MRSVTAGSASCIVRGSRGRRIGEKMGQRSKIVTADTYTHALVDVREVDRAKLLMRVSDVRAVQTPVQTPEDELAAFAG